MTSALPIHSQPLCSFPVPGLKSSQSPVTDQVHISTESYLPTPVEAASGEQLETKGGESTVGKSERRSTGVVGQILFDSFSILGSTQ